MTRIRVVNLLLISFVCILLALGGTAPSLHAGNKGKTKSAKKEKGKGEKTGWGDSNVPPGFQKWDMGKHKKWKGDLEAAK